MDAIKDEKVTTIKNQTEKDIKIDQYNKLLEQVYTDGTVNSVERGQLRELQKNLNLSNNEVYNLEKKYIARQEKEKTNTYNYKQLSPKDEAVIADFQQIANVIDTHSSMIIKNKQLGNVIYDYGTFGDISKKRTGGYGIEHIIEGRYRKDNLSQDEISAILYLINKTVKDTKLTEKQLKQNRIILQKDDIQAILSKEWKGTKEVWVITGYPIEYKKTNTLTKAATDAIQTVIAQYGYTPEFSSVRKQVGAVIAYINTSISQSQNKSSEISQSQRETIDKLLIHQDTEGVEFSREQKKQELKNMVLNKKEKKMENELKRDPKLIKETPIIKDKSITKEIYTPLDDLVLGDKEEILDSIIDKYCKDKTITLYRNKTNATPIDNEIIKNILNSNEPREYFDNLIMEWYSNARNISFTELTDNTIQDIQKDYNDNNELSKEIKEEIGNYIDNNIECEYPFYEYEKEPHSTYIYLDENNNLKYKLDDGKDNTYSEIEELEHKNIHYNKEDLSIDQLITIEEFQKNPKSIEKPLIIKELTDKLLAYQNTKEVKFSKEQEKRIDKISNAAFEFAKQVSNNPNLKYDVSLIEPILDIATQALNEAGYDVKRPYIDLEKNEVYNEYKATAQKRKDDVLEPDIPEPFTALIKDFDDKKITFEEADDKTKKYILGPNEFLTLDDIRKVRNSDDYSYYMNQDNEKNISNITNFCETLIGEKLDNIYNTILTHQIFDKVNKICKERDLKISYNETRGTHTIYNTSGFIGNGKRFNGDLLGWQSKKDDNNREYIYIPINMGNGAKAYPQDFNGNGGKPLYYDEYPDNNEEKTDAFYKIINKAEDDILTLDSHVYDRAFIKKLQNKEELSKEDIKIFCQYSPTNIFWKNKNGINAIQAAQDDATTLHEIINNIEEVQQYNKDHNNKTKLPNDYDELYDNINKSIKENLHTVNPLDDIVTLSDKEENKVGINWHGINYTTLNWVEFNINHPNSTIFCQKNYSAEYIKGYPCALAVGGSIDEVVESIAEEKNIYPKASNIIEPYDKNKDYRQEIIMDEKNKALIAFKNEDDIEEFLINTFDKHLYDRAFNQMIKEDYSREDIEKFINEKNPDLEWKDEYGKCVFDYSYNIITRDELIELSEQKQKTISKEAIMEKDNETKTVDSIIADNKALDKIISQYIDNNTITLERDKNNEIPLSEVKDILTSNSPREQFYDMIMSQYGDEEGKEYRYLIQNVIDNIKENYNNDEEISNDAKHEIEDYIYDNVRSEMPTEAYLKDKYYIKPFLDDKNKLDFELLANNAQKDENAISLTLDELINIKEAKTDPELEKIPIIKKLKEEALGKKYIKIQFIDENNNVKQIENTFSYHGTDIITSKTEDGRLKIYEPAYGVPIQKKEVIKEQEEDRNNNISIPIEVKTKTTDITFKADTPSDDIVKYLDDLAKKEEVCQNAKHYMPSVAYDIVNKNKEVKNKTFNQKFVEIVESIKKQVKETITKWKGNIKIGAIIGMTIASCTMFNPSKVSAQEVASHVNAPSNTITRHIYAKEYTKEYPSARNDENDDIAHIIKPVSLQTKNQSSNQINNINNKNNQNNQNNQIDKVITLENFAQNLRKLCSPDCSDKTLLLSMKKLLKLMPKEEKEAFSREFFLDNIKSPSELTQHLRFYIEKNPHIGYPNLPSKEKIPSKKEYFERKISDKWMENEGKAIFNTFQSLPKDSLKTLIQTSYKNYRDNYIKHHKKEARKYNDTEQSR